MANETIEVLRIPGTLFPRGAFDENASYKFLNIVESGGSGYVCLQPCTGIPVTNTAYWFKFVFKGDKGDAFTYADLTAEQKAELVRDATAAAQAAASSAQSAADDAAAVLQKFNTIKAAIDAIDPQSTEGSIQTLAAKQGLLEADLAALGPEMIYSSSSESLSASKTDGLSISTSTATFIENEKGRIRYVSVTEGDVINITGTTAKSRSIRYGYTDVVPALNVEVSDLVSLEQNSIDVTLTAPQDGYLCVYTLKSYYLDLAFAKITTTSVKEALQQTNEVVDGLVNSTPSYTSALYAILEDGNFGTTDSYKHRIYAVNAGEQYIITDQTSSNTTRYAFATSSSASSGGAIPIVTGTSVGIAAVGVLSEVTIPQGTSYLLVSDYSDVTVVRVGNVNANKNRIKAIEDKQTKIESKIDALITFTEIPINSLEQRNYWLNNSTLKWGQTISYKHGLLNLSDIIAIRIKANATQSAQLAWLTSRDLVAGEDAPVLDGMVHYIAAGTEEEFEVPEGAAFAYIYKGNNGYMSPVYLGVNSTSGDMSKAYMAEGNTQWRKADYATRSAVIGLTPITGGVTSGWEQPESVEVLNTVKKALQLINIKWTPKQPYPIPPSGSTARYAPAGTEFARGIPYSNNTSRFKRVGLEVSIHTFMTAINNPYSLCYTEKVDDADHYSIWGENYWAVNGTGYYGSVCCAFTSAALGIKYNVGNSRHLMAAKVLGMFVPLSKGVSEDNIDQLKIGDMADDEAHSYLIIGLRRDANGKIDKVRLGECTKGVDGCRQIEYTRENFCSLITNHESGNMVMFRYAGMFDNKKYEPSPYVALTDYGETEQTVTYNNDICTFAGDKATFMHGDLIVLNYDLDGNHSSWTEIEVYKDDVLLNTYTISNIVQSELPEGQRGHALNLGKELSAGKYKARMKNGSNYSEYTYWEVLDDNIQIDFSDYGNITLTGNSSGKIVAVYIGKSNYSTSEHYMYHGFWHNNVVLPPSIYERMSNSMTFNPWRFRQEYGYAYNDATHIVVMIEGLYGIAGTMPINISSSDSESEIEDDGD